jgi:hypothetical protein
MAKQLMLQEELTRILGIKVYFQPPESLKMTYPCVRYSIAGMDHKRANNMIYKNATRYEIIVIDYESDSEIYNLILNHFPMCSFDRVYIADNLYHYVLTLYY